jgi:pilus assembly protein CpaC
LLVVAALGLLVPDLAAQQVLTEPERVITVARGSSALLTRPTNLERVSIADPEIAEAVVISPTEILINANSVGTTSLLVWAQNDVVRLFNVEVAADVVGLERQLRTLFPDQDLGVSTAGNSVILSGTVRDPAVVRRALELANASGAQVINNIQAPSPEQVLLHVRFAEVARSALKEIGGDLVRIVNPQRLDEAFDEDDDVFVETLTEGVVSFTLLGEDSGLETVLRALKANGEFRSLAEPNLIALEGQEATFLAGGEFPYPTVQGAGVGAGATGAQTVTITFKEFGIRLRFTPNVTNTGSIRLQVNPEVSSLDFANGLTLSGFDIPSLVTRRVETQVELRPGQTLAIGGLVDNSITENVDKIPILGDIPILGFFFKSESARENRTELLVLVTPHIVEPSDIPPPIPTGEIETWDWSRYMTPDTTRVRRR